MRKIKAIFTMIPIYYKFARGKITRNGKEYTGFYYWLDKPINAAQKTELLTKYSNIVFFMSRSEYAPERIHNVIFLSDTKIREAIQ